MDDEANYTQDDPAFEAYITTAAAIVEGLRNGDDSEARQLPEAFQESLATRMRRRLDELQNGTIDQDEFDLEIRKMVSVACIGLRDMTEGS